MSKAEDSTVHRHEFTITEEAITCSKCGRSIPIIEKLQPEKPPLTIWCRIDRLGGLSGRALYFDRIVEVRHVLYNLMAAKPRVLLNEEDAERLRDSINNGTVESYFYIGNLKRDQPLPFVLKARLIYEPTCFLALSNDQLMDEYFTVKDTQLNDPSWSGYYDTRDLKFNAVKLQVKMGKILSISYEQYQGPIEPPKEWLINTMKVVEAENQKRLAGQGGTGAARHEHAERLRLY
jgi:hypothetical protein